MRLFSFVIFSAILLANRGLAQEDNVRAATSALQTVLSTLKENTDKLSLDNDQLAAKDKDIKQQILKLQAQLGQLEAQGNALNKTLARLKEQNPRRSQQSTRLEKENFDLDNQIQKVQDGIKVVQQSLDAGYHENQKLLLQRKAMARAMPRFEVQSPESQAALRRQKEKLRLMKMVYDSRQRQVVLHESILRLQKDVPLQPAAAALSHQQFLKDQIKDLEAKIAAYPPENSGKQYANPWDDAQLHQMELELKNLEQNYAQLKDLMEKMSQKAQANR